MWFEYILHFKETFFLVSQPGQEYWSDERGESSGVVDGGEEDAHHEQADDGAGDHPCDQGAHLEHAGEES